TIRRRYPGARRPRFGCRAAPRTSRRTSRQRAAGSSASARWGPSRSSRPPRFRPRIDAHRRREPGANLAEQRIAGVERDADGDALNDLGEIAGSVLRGNHAEDRPGAGGEALDMAVKNMVGQHIRDDGRTLSRLHARELVLLEIGIDPEAMRGNDRKEIGAARDIGAHLRGAVADEAVD